MGRKYRRRNSRVIFFECLVFVVLLMWIGRGVIEAEAVSRREGLNGARQALLQAAVSCYALDGVYPATYEDLKKKSGILIEEDKYAVVYEAFGRNIMPSIEVVDRIDRKLES